MPTRPPPKVESPKSKEERIARKAAKKLFDDLYEKLYNYSYGTRSFMPGDLDFTDFITALSKVRKFCHARPDWLLKIMTDIGALHTAHNTNQIHNSIKVILDVMDYALDSDQVRVNRHIWVANALRDILNGISIKPPPRHS